MRRQLIGSGLVVLAASTLVACTFSASAGTIGGIIGTLLLVGALIFGVGGTQSGCDDSRTVQDSRVGPCLSPPAPDMGPDTTNDLRVGPCLQPPPPEAGPDQSPDIRIGPCLSVPAPDAGVEQGVRDQGREIPIGPCLSLPPRDASSSLDPVHRAPRADDAQPAGERERRALVEKLAANLPADVLARLRGGDADADADADADDGGDGGAAS